MENDIQQDGLNQAALDAAVDSMMGTTPTEPVVQQAEAPKAPEPAPAPAVEQSAPKADPLAEIAKREEARRLADILRQRDEYAAKLQEVESKTKQQAPEKKDTFSPQDLRRLAIESPDEMAKAMGMKDAAALAKFLWSKKMGPDGGVDTTQDEAFLTLQSRIETQEQELRRLREESQQKLEQETKARAAEEEKSSLVRAAEAHLDAMPRVKAFLLSQKEKTANSLRAIAEEMRQTDPGVSPTMVAVELERRLGAVADKRIQELEAELSAWKLQAVAPATNANKGQAAPAKASTPKTLTSADGVAGKDPVSLPATEEERLAEAARWLKEQLAMEQGGSV